MYVCMYMRGWRALTVTWAEYLDHRANTRLFAEITRTFFLSQHNL